MNECCDFPNEFNRFNHRSLPSHQRKHAHSIKQANQKVKKGVCFAKELGTAVIHTFLVHFIHIFVDAEMQKVNDVFAPQTSCKRKIIRVMMQHSCLIHAFRKCTSNVFHKYSEYIAFLRAVRGYSTGYGSVFSHHYFLFCSTLSGT